MGIPIEEIVDPYSAFDVDCVHMKNDFGLPENAKTPGGKGFLVVLSDRELDVVAVYSAGVKKNKKTSVVSTDVENIKPRIVLPDTQPPPIQPRPLRAMRVEPAFPKLTFERLTNLIQPDDGHDHIFVTEQTGRIRVFPNDQGAEEAETFMDITDRVNSSAGGGEEGLLGLAFDPEYESNGYFYVYYSAANPRRSVVSRFSVSLDNPNAADLHSELVIIEIGQPFINRNAGQIAFGPDGYLYIALGDGGGSGGDPFGNGQNRGTLLSSLLRIDVSSASDGKSYSVPPDNPFVGVAGARDEIWAYGLRNPWRFSFDEATGTLWLADVGQNRWEEIDIIEKGLNYGWKFMEGRHCFSPSVGCDQADLELPIWEYEHFSSGCLSITGGYVYRGREMPSLFGAYVYGDYCSGRI